MTLNEWLEYGYKQGFCGPPVCEIHDGLPTSPYEDEEFNAGFDPCITILRLYGSRTEKEAIEENHSPSVWRAVNEGFRKND